MVSSLLYTVRLLPGPLFHLLPRCGCGGGIGGRLKGLAVCVHVCLCVYCGKWTRGPLCISRKANKSLFLRRGIPESSVWYTFARSRCVHELSLDANHILQLQTVKS